MGLFSFLGDVFEAIGNAVKNIVKGAVKAIKWIVKGVVGGIKALGRGIKRLLANDIVKIIILIVIIIFAWYYAPEYIGSWAGSATLSAYEAGIVSTAALMTVYYVTYAALSVGLYVALNALTNLMFPIGMFALQAYTQANELFIKSHIDGSIYMFYPGGFMYNAVEPGGFAYNPTGKLDKYAYAYGYPDLTDKSNLINYIAPFEDKPGGTFFHQEPRLI